MITPMDVMKASALKLADEILEYPNWIHSVDCYYTNFSGHLYVVDNGKHGWHITSYINADENATFGDGGWETKWETSGHVCPQNTLEGIIYDLPSFLAEHMVL